MTHSDQPYQSRLFEIIPAAPAEVDTAGIAAVAQQQYEAGTETSPAEQVDRLRIMRDEAGFYPTNHDELARAFAIKDYRGTVVGTSGYLNTIFLHQRDRTEALDPTAAVRSVVSEMAGYARKAKSDKTALSALQQELLDKHSIDRRSSLAQAGIVNGTGQLVRYHDLDRVALTGDLEEVPIYALEGAKGDKRTAFDVYTAAEPTRETRQRIETVLGEVKLWEARGMIEELILDQTKRFKFWTENISDSKRHDLARPVANTVLKRLGVIPMSDA